MCRIRPPRPDIDLEKTAFLGHLVRHWEKLPLAFLNELDPRSRRYGFIGLADRTMYPLLQPGSLVVIDETRRKIASGGWTSEFDGRSTFSSTARPICAAGAR